MNRLPFQPVRLSRQQSGLWRFAQCTPSLTSLVIALTITSFGCTKNSNTKSTGTPGGRVQLEQVVAQGQILPANGLIRLAATPGDTVENVNIAVGDEVTTDQPLIVMRSHQVRKSQLEAVNIRLEDAKQQQVAAIEQAKLGVTAAELKVKQTRSQFDSAGRQDTLLALAKDQVDASKSLLQKLESITSDPLTKQFIGGIELKRQQIAVAEAELKYRQQVESLSQTRESIEWAATAANQELSAAQTALRIAMESSPLAPLEAERSVLELQLKSSTIRAPRDAVVVAINTQVGESAAQYPLVELAETNNIICAVEVVEADASLITQDQVAKISSPALPKVLTGKVLRRDRLVGRPQLPSADPLAKADYRTANVIVAIDPADAEIASKWLQLQVKVQIDVADATEKKLSSADAVPAP